MIEFKIPGDDPKADPSLYVTEPDEENAEKGAVLGLDLVDATGCAVYVDLDEEEVDDLIFALTSARDRARRKARDKALHEALKISPFRPGARVEWKSPAPITRPARYDALRAYYGGLL